MAVPDPHQEWAKDPEAGASDASGHPTTAGDARPYADTDRFGKTQTGDTKPITAPLNRISDDVWGVNNTAGGTNGPGDPEINIASK
jgi:hypothetical protein